MSGHATTEEVEQLRQSCVVLLGLIGDTLRALASDKPNVFQVRTLLRQAASDMLDPALKAEALEQVRAVLARDS